MNEAMVAKEINRAVRTRDPNTPNFFRLHLFACINANLYRWVLSEDLALHVCTKRNILQCQCCGIYIFGAQPISVRGAWSIEVVKGQYLILNASYKPANLMVVSTGVEMNLEVREQLNSDNELVEQL